MTGLIAVALVLFLASCTRPDADPSQAPAPALYWPPPPAEPRIQFVRSFSQPEDLGITGGFLQQLGELFKGRSVRRLIRPMAIVATSDGVLYVADPGSRGVHRFAAGKGRYELIRRKDRQPLPSPVGLTAGPDGEVYVADSALNQILVITPGSKIAVPLPLQTMVEQPTAVALDPAARQLYVVDTGRHQIKVFGVDGRLRTTLGRRGADDGEFNYPVAIWRDSTRRTFVTDSLNFRIQIFDAEATFAQKFGTTGDATGDLARPKGVATDRFGHIYVVDSLFHAVQIFNLSGDFLLAFGGQGQQPGEFWLPTGIFIGANDMIYVADSHNQRVQVFRYVGGGS